MTNTPTQSQTDVEELGRVQGPPPMTVPTPTEAEAMSARLEIEAEGWRQSAENQARDHGEGTEVQEFMEETAALFDEAAAFIRSAATALRTSDEARVRAEGRAKRNGEMLEAEVVRAAGYLNKVVEAEARIAKLMAELQSSAVAEGQWHHRAEAAEARVKELEEQALHHASGERITRKDLNNAYRAGQENGRLAAHLIDGAEAALARQSADTRPAEDWANELAPKLIAAGCADDAALSAPPPEDALAKAVGERSDG